MALTPSTLKTSAAGSSSAQDSDNGWQKNCKSFAEMGKFFLERGLMSDVELRCYNTQGSYLSIRAHRLILVASSPMFELMLSIMNSGFRNVECIRIESEKAVVEVLIKLIYGYDDSGLLTVANVFQVLRVSEKYKVHIAVARCEAWIKENMNATNCLAWLITAEKSQAANSDVTIQEHCWKHIDESAAEVFRCAKFLEIDRSLLLKILKRNSLRVEELAVYEAAVKWASSACKREAREDNARNRRFVLGEAVYQIRFTLMSAKEFLDGPLKSELLSLDEVSSIMHHMITDKKSALQFVTEPRVILSNGTFKVERFASTYGKRMYFYEGVVMDSVRFSVDRDITLLGCGIYTSGKHTYRVKVKIFTGVDTDLIHQENIAVPALCSRIVTGPACVVAIKFAKELSIKRSTQCVIQCDIDGKESDYGITGKGEATAKVTLDNGNSVLYSFSFLPGPASETSVRSAISSGQIPTILFRP